MKSAKILAILVLSLGLMVCQTKLCEATPMGTAFTYQGYLYDANHPANDIYDFQFKLHNALVGGGQVGSDVNTPDVDVIDGSFTVELDFGSDVFDGNAVWLEIGVRPGEMNDPNVYTTLSPRQEVTPTPYALYAETAASIQGGVSWSEVSDRPAGLDDGDDVGITSETDTLQSVCNRGSSSSTAVDISGTSSPMLDVTNTNGIGGNAIMGHTTGDSPGVRGSSNKGHGVYGITAAESRHGVYGNHNSTVNSGSGGYFRTSHAESPAVWAYSKDGTNYGIQCDGYAVVNGRLQVSSNSLFGGVFTSDYPSSDTDAVHAEYTGSGGYDAAAVFGHCAPQDYYGYGGYFRGGYKGVHAEVLPTGSGTYYGVRGYVSGGSGTNCAIYGSASGSGTNWAGYFGGNVNVTGTLSKGAGSFKIDHPLDPENKYLYHSFVESPDMMNVYNGNVTTDENGDVIVQLPQYFSALNKDFRYQLTVIGQFARAIVSEEINGNQFSIKTDEPQVKVSWQVTGIRKDAFAEANRIQVEVNKPVKERGFYLHPKAYALPEEKGIESNVLSDKNRKMLRKGR